MFGPFSAVPVFPAIFTPMAPWLNAFAVPPCCWTTASIIWLTLLATAGETAWFNTEGAVFCTVLRSLATMPCTTYGFISLPPLAIAAENMASCIAVAVSLNCPIAEYAVSASLGAST